MSKEKLAKIAYDLIKEKKDFLCTEIYTKRNELHKSNNLKKENQEKENIIMIGDLFDLSVDIENKYRNILFKYEDIIESLISED